LISAIHRALGVPEGRRDVLAPLAAVLVSSAGPSREVAITRLVEALNEGATPGVLVDLMGTQTTVLNPFRYERGAGWPFGTHASRRSLVDELWARAAAESSAKPSSARRA
jgi:hypothetical protein